MDQQATYSNIGYVKLSDSKEQHTQDTLLGSRKILLSRLTELIQNTHNSYVIGLNSEWGSGKTFFLNKWRSYLRKHKPKSVCIYFNAWTNDFAGDPLANLMATVEDQVLDPEAKMNKQLIESAKLVTSAAFKIIKWGGKIITVTGDPLGGAIARFTGNFGEWILKRVKDASAADNNFCTKLENFSSTVRKETDFPLFIMVDELDRCRPDYAIEMLERIKHLFNVPNVVFLLAIDGEQLLQIVEHTFGLKPSYNNATKDEQGNFNGRMSDTRINYLGKFIDIFYQLPEPDRQEFVRMKLESLSVLKVYSEKESNSEYLHSGLINVLTADERLFGNKSLRELIQNLELFSVFLRSYDNLCFEEIFTAFIIIMGNINRMKFSQNVTMALRKMYSIDQISSDLKKIFDLNDATAIKEKKIIELFGLDKPEKAAHLFVCLGMLYPAESMNGDFSNFKRALTLSVTKRQPFSFLGISLVTSFTYFKRMDDVEKNLDKKLRMLEDFSKVISTEYSDNLSATINIDEAHAST